MGAVRKEWKTNVYECQMDQLRKHMTVSITSNLDSAVWGAEAECINLDRAAGVVIDVRNWKLP